ncbi:hypothetical protein [Hyphomonas sp.]|uniref:hypothetical protein n=1 Tax=Hyphomonas sp. TaxID=87 RepID=UPI0032EF23CD
MRQKSGPKASSAEKHVQAIKRQIRRMFSAEEKILKRDIREPYCKDRKRRV